MAPTRSRSQPTLGRQQTRMHVQNPTWQRDAEHGKVTLSRCRPSSIWEKKLPEKRHHRKLSWSKVGLAGNSPTYCQMRGPSPTREQRCRDRIKMTIEMKNLDKLWEIYIESAAWHQDEHAKWPISNHEFVAVRRAIEQCLKKKIKTALATDTLEDLEAAANAAANKVDILAFEGNASFPELDEVYHRINQKQAELVGMSRKSTVPDADKTAAMEALDLAIEAQDGEELSKAIQAAIELNVDVTEASTLLKLSSKYFSSDAKDGLFAKDCFKGEKRTLYILNLGPEMDLNLLERILKVRGVNMKYYTNMKELLKPPQDRESRKGMSIAASLHGKKTGVQPLLLQDPPKNTLWVISGPEPSKLAGDMAAVGKLIEFNRQGGGLGIIGSGNRGGLANPLICDANVLLSSLSLERMWGHYDGKKQVGPQPGSGKPGFNEAHKLFTNISKLDEGFSTTALADSVLKQGFVELLRGSSGKPLTAIREPSRAFSGSHGPIILHASAMHLLGSKEGVGHEQWLANLFLYSCLRAADMVEEFDFGAEGAEPKEGEGEGEGEEGEDEEDVGVVNEQEAAEDLDDLEGW